MKPEKSSQVLLITSTASTRDQLRELLEGTQFAVETTENAESGIRKAEELMPVVILVDLEGNHGHSFETCRLLRADRLLANIPIIMLSYRTDRDARAAGLSAGVNDFIEKPFDGLEVYARLTTLARLSTYQFMLTDLTRFSWMVEHAQEGYLMLDKSGAIHYANEHAQHLLNISAEYLGLPFRKVVERIYLPEPIETWEAWDEDPSPCFLVQPESPTARTVWVVLEALDTPMGAEYQRIVRLRDVTERMSIYHDMRRFHTVVAHKLRTPMSIMYTNINLIKNKLDMLSPEEVKDFAKGAIGGADRLVAQIRQILTYIDAPLAINMGDPLKLEQVPDILNNVSEVLGCKQISLSLPEELKPIQIALTVDAMEMIFQELVENARKFHPSHYPHIEIAITRSGPEIIHIRVADDGMNLSTEQIKWALLPYFQGEKDFTGELPGMGLGLPIVATLVWKAGGHVRLHNQPAKAGIIVDMAVPFESAARKIERSVAPYRG